MLKHTSAAMAAMAFVSLPLAILGSFERPARAHVEPVQHVEEQRAPAWAPPAWLPGAALSPLAVGALDGPPLHEDGPRVRSRAAFIADLDRGEVLYTRRADERFPVASLTKMVSALALASEQPELDRELCVGPEQYTTRSGARSRFETGVCHTGWEWLGAALVASDNRGAMGLPALADLRYEDFIERMGEVSVELGMEQATWTDPTGLEVNDMATARDMARAVVALAAEPSLQPVASAPSWTIHRRNGPHKLGTTNRLVHRYETLAAKTGYTDPARYCFATAIEAGGTRYAVVVLGAPTSSARFSDARRLVEWARTRAS